MVHAEKRYIDALYDNCREHIDGSDEAWKKALAYFKKAAESGDQETLDYAVRRLKQLEDETEGIIDALKPETH